MRLSRKLFLRTLAGAGLASFTLLSQAQAWPAKPVRLVVPFPAGGATDTVARVVAQQVATETGQSFIVDNKAGAGGTLGATEGMRAAADGYTLVFTTSSTHAISPHLMAKAPYDPVKDFTPIAHVADAASVLLVTPGLPVKSVAELISYAKAHPGELNYASSGNGTIVHLTTEAFRSQAGLQMLHVPYKGTGPALTDLAAGNVQVLFDSIPTGLPHVRSGRLKALAVTGGQRSPLMPELPTVAEAGLPGFTSVTWFGLYGPARLPADVVRQINAAFNKALRAPEVGAKLAQLGAEPAAPQSPEAFAAMVAKDSKRWGQLIRERKITVD
ncbi:tripartite tricarboxylate transporter substrate binding protein [Aquincola tertiaricarbonis]|uniref:Tripartite tricarboxylate transporter substrate binding protein n=1 Tax=Aquincola tertiaricarbonis TaxID=391953 RepID=A0ABY4S8N7_AQUTE|nr:tripartite tricarboxylate transporter substrate binding protein [Aquincola tertiaricarbonis]URI08088.1 tripartite tricarboxylate transporter substrate binding protein [Aquincola tertiaricarbonis]